MTCTWGDDVMYRVRGRDQRFTRRYRSWNIIYESWAVPGVMISKLIMPLDHHRTGPYRLLEYVCEHVNHEHGC